LAGSDRFSITWIKPHDGTEDADGRRIAAGGLPDLGRQLQLALVGADLDLHDLAQAIRLGAIDQELQAPPGKGIRKRGDLAFEGQQAFLARHLAPARDVLDQLLRVDRRREKHPDAHFHAVHEDRQRALQHDRTQRAAEDDEHRGGLDQGTDMSALQHLADHDGGNSEGESGNADLVHGSAVPYFQASGLWERPSAATPVAPRGALLATAPGLAHRLVIAHHGNAQAGDRLAVQLANP
jgi:hypothetical protein